MLVRVAAVAVVVAACASPVVQAPHPQPERREVRLELAPTAEGMSVVERFRGDPSGHTRLAVPTEWAGQHGLERGIVDLAVENGTLQPPGAQPRERIVDHAPGAQLAVRYLVKVTPTEKGDYDRYYRPIFAATYFHFFSDAALVLPQWREHQPVHAVFTWQGLAPAEPIETSFGSGPHQEIDTTIDRLSHALFVGGEFRVLRLQIHDRPVTVAIRGTFAFRDDELLELARRVLVAEREFWNDFDAPRFLITVLQTGTRCCGYGGTGVTDAFATALETDHGIDPELSYLFAHELFHTWNGGKIEPTEPERLVYWFTEGFTDYYARIFELRAHLIDLPTYVEKVNRLLADYARSPARTVTNQQVLDGFWKDPAVEKIPYQRGALLAMNWNARIKAHGAKSLDDAMRDLLAAARAHGTKSAPASVDAAIATYLGTSIADDLARHVDRGEPISPDRDALGPCAQLSTAQTFEFDPGWDLSAHDVVHGVRPDGPAYRVGLRDGQRIVGLSIWKGDPDKRLEVTVRDANGDTKFSYLPRGAARDVPRFTLDAAAWAADPARCLAWFGVAR